MFAITTDGDGEEGDDGCRMRVKTMEIRAAWPRPFTRRSWTGLCREQFVGEKCGLPLGKIYVALSDLWAQLERSLPEEDDVPNLMTNMTQYRKSKTRRGGMNKRLARKSTEAPAIQLQ
ncbi:unnamed protein product [Symbiodinium sp. CCMP2592]|nr:unnamed protein product [Symbiodinium sp. CCMP2592]